MSDPRRELRGVSNDTLINVIYSRRAELSREDKAKLIELIVDFIDNDRGDAATLREMLIDLRSNHHA